MASNGEGFRVRQRLAVSARARPAQLPPRLQGYLDAAEASLAEPFKGITGNGTPVPGLFPLQATSVSTRALADTAVAFLDALGPEQRARALFPVDGDAWRRWSMPSASEPWGWQIDGHHLIVNCFVLGDQVVMTPMFMGSEPVTFTEGPEAGRRVFDAEERQGLGLIQALTPEQRRRTILGDELPGEVFTAAFRDNLELTYAGIEYGRLSPAQQHLLRRLIDLYVGRIRPGHARIRSEEVERHLAGTHFAWIGGVAADSVFYYRIHSPVILIEFDHQRGIAFDNDEPSRHHVHTVVRTPNGNDYGRDLLRQHHARFAHAAHGSPQPVRQGRM